MSSLVPRPRNRGRESVVPGSACFEVQSGPVANGTIPAGFSGSVGWKETMSDTVIPSFSLRSSRGEVFFNPMAKNRQDFSSSSTVASLTQVAPQEAEGQRYSFTGDILSQKLAEGLSSSNDLVSPVILGNLPVNACISEACTSAAVRPTDASMLVSLAESRQTIALFPDLLRSLGDYLRRFNSAVPPRSSRGLGSSLRSSVSVHERFVTNLWLQMRFGLRPLISDIQGALTALNRHYTDSVSRQTGRGQGQFSLDEVLSGELVGGILRFPYVRSTKNSVSVRATSLWEARITLLDSLGISARALPEAAIDLVGFSFVANWMINVNSFAASIGRGLDYNARYLGGCYTVQIERSTTWQLVGGDYNTVPSNYATTGSSSGLAVATALHKYRVPGLVSPSLVVRGDPFKFLTDLRLLDAVALVSQQLRGRNFQTAMRLGARGLL